MARKDRPGSWAGVRRPFLIVSVLAVLLGFPVVVFMVSLRLFQGAAALGIGRAEIGGLAVAVGVAILGWLWKGLTVTNVLLLLILVTLVEVDNHLAYIRHYSERIQRASEEKARTRGALR